MSEAYRRLDTDRLERVIVDVARTDEAIPEGMFLAKWMVIGVAEDPNDPGRHTYFRMPSNGYMAPHEALGLLQITANMVMSDTEVDDD